MSGEALDAAAAALDRALQARPRLDGAALTVAAAALCQRRDTLRRRLREGGAAGARAELKVLNATLSLVHAGHYPLSGVPWDLLETARSQVAALRTPLDPLARLG